jgi:hypothetical protein
VGEPLWTETGFAALKVIGYRPLVPITAEDFSDASELADLARRFQEERKRKGLPYLSLETGERVPGRQG